MKPVRFYCERWSRQTEMQFLWLAVLPNTIEYPLRAWLAVEMDVFNDTCAI